MAVLSYIMDKGISMCTNGKIFITHIYRSTYINNLAMNAFYSSQNLVIQRSNVAAIYTVFCVGIVAGVSNPIFGRICSFGCAAEYRIRNTRNENHTARGSIEGISNIQNTCGQSHWINGHSWKWDAARQGSMSIQSQAKQSKAQNTYYALPCRSTALQKNICKTRHFRNRSNEGGNSSLFCYFRVLLYTLLVSSHSC